MYVGLVGHSCNAGFTLVHCSPLSKDKLYHLNTFDTRRVQPHLSYGQFLYVTKIIRLGLVSLGLGGLG